MPVLSHQNKPVASSVGELPPVIERVVGPHRGFRIGMRSLGVELVQPPPPTASVPVLLSPSPVWVSV